MELETIPLETREDIERIGGCDLVIGLPALDDAERAPSMIAGIEAFLTRSGARPATVVIHSDTVAAALSSYPQLSEAGAGLRLISYPFSSVRRFTAMLDGLSESLHAVLAISKSLGARACGFFGSDVEELRAQWMGELLLPVLESKFDLVVPSYARSRFDGLVTSGILYPLVSSLYGKRVRWPFAGDFGFSARLVDRFLVPAPPSLAAGRRGTLVWVVTEAICDEFQICQAHVAARVRAPKDTPDVSAVLSNVLGPLFLDMERRAASWQRIRNSHPVASLGEFVAVAETGGDVDVGPIIESFQFAFQNLQEVWALVLPPATLLELKRLTRFAPDRFRMPDDLWARIIYDFALAHRLRVLNRDHLLRALTPLYRAWVASYAVSVQHADDRAVEQRVEGLRSAFETHKPYLLSRWRWPDRFSP